MLRIDDSSPTQTFIPVGENPEDHIIPHPHTLKPTQPIMYLPHLEGLGL
jgi:hypothetical protein